MKHIPGFEQIFGCPVYLVSDEERFLICKKPPFPMLGAYRKFRGDPSAKNGCIFLFEEYYTLPAEYRHYIVWHEAGHLHSYPDRSEEAADRWAIRNCTEPDGKKAWQILHSLDAAIRATTMERLKKKGIAIPALK